jgi:NAD(P)H-dependent flavin oxidoreductase YrpB (nitropropane dioxygenase family)
VSSVRRGDRPSPAPPAREALASVRLIQGGMGAGISGWRLARAVSLLDQLGVVSGTGADALFVRRLQCGDAGGHLRRAAAEFPLRGVAEDALRRFFRPEGRAPGQPYAALPLDGLATNSWRQRLIALSCFCEVRLAKEGHDRPVGLNLLTKIQAPNLASLWGAMLAGVDVVLMGAGIPREVPAALDALAAQQSASLRLEVSGLRPEEAPRLVFDPREHGAGDLPPLRRPWFVPIVSSNVLADVLVKKGGGVDGLVVETPAAGGHLAPPRGEWPVNERGEPVYGRRDEVALERIAGLGLPFWLAGAQGWPDRLQAALEAGAAGVQVGTFFAYCRESGLCEQLKQEVVRRSLAGPLDVVADARASPTGFPFRVVSLPGTLADPELAAPRGRRCDMGYLRTAYVQPDGRVGFRCPAEPVEAHVAKGGEAADTVGRRCLCNALMANAGFGQVRPDGVELPLLTSGSDLRRLGEMLRGRSEYAAADVVAHVLG